MRGRRGFLAVAALVAAACGDAGIGARASLIIENQSDYDVLELRIHADKSYAEEKSLIDGPLRPGASIVRHVDPQPLYVTIYREKMAGGRVVAHTTATPLELQASKGYRLLVFETSFRLEDAPFIPEPGAVRNPDGAVRDAARDDTGRHDAAEMDAGVADAGAADGGAHDAGVADADGRDAEGPDTSEGPDGG